MFLGTADTEPYVSLEHVVRTGGDNFSPEVCAEEDCVLCPANASGDKRVGRVAPKYNFNVFDIRWQKKTLDKKRSEKEGKERFKYEFLADDEVTDIGIRKGYIARAGHVSLEYPPMHVGALDSVNRQAGKRCRCGGKISVSGYKNKDGANVTKKVRELDDDEIDSRLESGKIREILACSKCEEPERVSIFNSIVQIGRSGEGKSTTYQFQILPQDEIPDDVLEAIKEVKLYNWAEIKQPKPANALATMLGIRNPNKKRGDDDEEEEDVVDYDEEADESEVFDEEDDEEDEKPRRATKKKAKKR